MKLLTTVSLKKIEKDRRMKILNEGVEQLNTAGIEDAGKLLKDDAVDKID